MEDYDHLGNSREAFPPNDVILRHALYADPVNLLSYFLARNREGRLDLLCL